jgi:hypothetical protein
MARSGKVYGNMASKSGKSLGILVWGVKNCTQKIIECVKKMGFQVILCERSGNIYTKNLFSYICCLVSFPVFAQTSITTIIYIKGISNKGGVWK